MTSSITAKILEPLNEQQREAATTLEGPVLIVAGAGTGKTRAITHRMAYLVAEKKISAWEIFAATFTNKAAGEMRQRVLDLLNLTPTTRFSIATFHSHCSMILRREAEILKISPNFTICDEADQKSLIKKILRELNIKPDELEPGLAQWFINQAKMKLQLPEDLDESVETETDSQLLAVYRRYQREMAEGGGLDFEDLILKTVMLFTDHPEVLARYHERYKYILIDEYQDTNHSQFCLVRLLAGERKNVCVVGDEDQSIYSWRGAEISNLLEFPRHFPGARIIKLEQNYRSRGNILKAAAAVIENNQKRIGKRLFTDVDDGPPLGLIKADRERDEAQMVAEYILRLGALEGVPMREIAIFYRANSLSRVFEDAFRAQGIAHIVVGGVKFYDRAEVKDCLAYLRLLSNPSDSLSLIRIINKPARGIGAKTVEVLQNTARNRGMTPFDVVIGAESVDELPRTAKKKLADFGRMLKKWYDQKSRRSPSDMLGIILDDTGYLTWLKKVEGFNFDAKRENVEELVSAMKIYEGDHPTSSLSDYLNDVALTTSVDEVDRSMDSVSLMTVHNAKGLEFDTVFIVGLEDGIFPSHRAVEEQGDLEEERRLFYVALTRAQRRCFISYSSSRMMFGKVRWNVPSPFLYEISRDVLIDGPTALSQGDSFKGAPSKPRLDSTVGREVRHPFFGDGKIVGVKAAGGKKKLVIAFSDGLIHEILEKYADLEYL